VRSSVENALAAASGPDDLLTPDLFG